MKVLGQSIVKANNDVFENNTQRKNEDSWIQKANHIAVSDGAGGIGILADKWSEIMVKNVPDKPFDSTRKLDEWISAFWEKFYKINSKEMTDPWQIKKFDEEGSLATLSVLWQTCRNKFHYQSYGDTALFVFNKKSGKLKIQDNIRSVNYFGTNPALINWKTEEHLIEFFFEQKIDLNEEEEIILATDGIAMYIYGAYLSFQNKNEEEVTESKMFKILEYFSVNPIKDFKVWMEVLKSSLNSEDAFVSLTSDWYKNKFLPNDDYTLVWIENEEKKTTSE